MVICDITQFYSETSGGIKTYLEAKGNYIAGSGKWKQVMIVPYKDDVIDEMPGRTVYKLKAYPFPWNRQYRLILNPAKCCRLLIKEKPDIIEVGSPDMLSWIAIRYAKKHDIPCIGFYHSDYPDTYFQFATKRDRFKRLATFPHWLAWEYTKLLYNKFEVTLVASSGLKEKLLKNGIRNAHLVPLGVDTNIFTPDKKNSSLIKNLGLERGLSTVLYIGRLSNDKCFGLFVDSVKALWVYRKTNCLIAGEGPLRGLALRFQKEFPEHVRYLGYVSKEMVAMLYASSDVLLLPSKHETFGLAALEGLASGIPVVYQKTYGFSDTLCNEAGFLVDDPCPKSFASVVLKVLNIGVDNLGQKARDFVLTYYSWDKTFSELGKLYEFLVHKKGCSSN